MSDRRKRQQVCGKTMYPKIAVLREKAMSAKMIGMELGLSRSQVLGIIHRHEPIQKETYVEKQRRINARLAPETNVARFKKCQGFLDLENDFEPTCPEEAMEGKSYCAKHQAEYFRKPTSAEKADVKRVAGL